MNSFGLTKKIKNLELKSKCMGVVRVMSDQLNKTSKAFTGVIGEMIGSIEKGVERSKISQPTYLKYKDTDLTKIPSFISYKTAIFIQRQTLYSVIGLLAFLFIFREVYNYKVIHGLNEQISKKEVILAPGINEFTKAYKNRINDDYVAGAMKDFLFKLGTYDSTNIASQYSQLSKYMSPSLRAQFDIETEDLINAVEAEAISEILTVQEYEVIDGEDGRYRATALVKIKRFAGDIVLSPRYEAITLVMTIKNVAQDTKWFLEITDLVRENQSNFNKRGKKNV